MPLSSDPWAVSYKLIERLNELDFNCRPNDHLTFDTPIATLQALSSNNEQLEAFTADEFATLIANFFREMFEVSVVTDRPDTGFDLIISDDMNQRAIVEVKKYHAGSRVSVSVVREVLGAMLAENVDNGILVSAVPFTMAALSFARAIQANILLMTIDDLLRIHAKSIRSISELRNPT